jgi:single-stranded DNA-binding protein
VLNSVAQAEGSWSSDEKTKGIYQKQSTALTTTNSVCLWFVAFGALGEALARHARKGDQLIIEAKVRANTWTTKEGSKQYEHDFVVEGFRYGKPGVMRRAELRAQEDAKQGAA